MDDNIAIFLVLIVSMAAALVLVLSTFWMRRTRPLAAVAQAGGDFAHLSRENDVLREQVCLLEQRLGAVEHRVTNAMQQLAPDDAALRLQKN